MSTVALGHFARKVLSWEKNVACNFIIIIIIIIIIIVSFMQGSHTHIPETNHVPTGCIVAAILSLLFMVPLCLVPALAIIIIIIIIIINCN